MTCVVGVRDGHRVWLGSDSCSADSWSVVERAEPKVFSLDVRNEARLKVGVAIAGNWKLYDFLHEMEPVPPVYTDPDRWMRRVFGPALRDVVDRYLGSAVQSERWNGIKDGSALVAAGGRLFSVYLEGDQIAESPEYAALGSGVYVALGSLATSRDRRADERVLLALAAAGKHARGVRQPFEVHSFGASASDFPHPTDIAQVTALPSATAVVEVEE